MRGSLLDLGAEINQSCVFRVLFNEGTGSPLELVTRTLGTLGAVNGTTFPTWQSPKIINVPTGVYPGSTPQVIGHCLGTDGTNGFLTWPSSHRAAKLATPLTIFGRIYVPNWNTSISIFSEDDNSPTGGPWLSISGRNPVYRIGSTSILTYSTGFTTAADGYWSTLAISDSGTVQTLYMNGLAVATTSTTTSSPTTSGTIYLGTRGAAHGFISSLNFHDVAAWTRVLSPAEHFLISQDPGWGIQEPSLRRMMVFSFGNSYSFSISESVTLGDSFAASVAFSATISESITAGDSLTATASFNASTSDSITAGDSLSGSLAVHASISESITAGDSFTATASFAASIADSIAAGDSLGASASFADVVAETITAADSLAGSLAVHATFTESVTLGDSITFSSSTATLSDRFKPELIAYLETLLGSQGVSVRHNRATQDDVYPLVVIDVHRQPEALLSGAANTRTADVNLQVLDTDDSVVDLITTQVIDAFNNKVNFMMGTVSVMDSQVDLDSDDYDVSDDGSDEGTYTDQVSLTFHYRVNPS